MSTESDLIADDERVRSLVAGMLNQAYLAGVTGSGADIAERTDAVMRGLRALSRPVSTGAAEPQR